jgi:uncharacterized membrane protein YcaP (DUF421 family)
MMFTTLMFISLSAIIPTPVLPEYTKLINLLINLLSIYLVVISISNISGLFLIRFSIKNNPEMLTLT